MNPAPNRHAADALDIFSDPRLEGRDLQAFEGVIDARNPAAAVGLTEATAAMSGATPEQVGMRPATDTVTAYVLPGRETSALQNGFAEGKPYQMTRAALYRHSAYLGSKEAVGRALYNRAQPEHQRVQTDIQAMRQSQVRAAQSQLDPLRLAQERESAAAEDPQQEQFAEKAAAPAPAPPRARVLKVASKAEFDAKVSAMWVAAEEAARHLGTHGKEALHKATQDDVAQLTAAWEAERQAAAAWEASRGQTNPVQHKDVVLRPGEQLRDGVVTQGSTNAPATMEEKIERIKGLVVSGSLSLAAAQDMIEKLVAKELGL